MIGNTENAFLKVAFEEICFPSKFFVKFSALDLSSI